MDKVKHVLSTKEMETLGRAIEAYRLKLEEKMAELDQVQTHLKVNEGLMQEVRQEKDRIRGEMGTCQTIIQKIQLLSGDV